MVIFFKKLLMQLFTSKEVIPQTSKREAFINEQQQLQEPWATFEIVGFEGNGRIKVSFNWNKAFIKKLDGLGFTAETEEDTVQLFFYASQMKPSGLGGDDPVQSADLPTLSENVNRFIP